MPESHRRWRHGGFAAFRQGEFDNGGDNLYVTRAGAVEWIHRTDVNGDGHVDLVFPNSHGYDERGPTWIYTQPPAPGAEWGRRELPNDSGWMSHAADLDGDGFLDLIVVNAENGVTSELDCYVYWGGPDGLTGARSELPTAGAYDVAAVDLTGNGLLDLILPSAWVDHHNAGAPRPLHVYLQTRPRVFEDATERFAIPGVAALAVACEDLDGDGELELVVANYRAGFEHDTDSFIYRRRGSGFAVETPLRLPTHYAMQVELADLDGDGRKEVIFAGGDQVQIYWNRNGGFSTDQRTILQVAGNWSQFAQGAVRVAAADVDGDGRDELLVVNGEGVQIRSTTDLHEIRQTLPLAHASWLHAADLDGDGRIDLIVSRLENGRSYETESVVFWNGPAGFSPRRVTPLATGGAMGCIAADLDRDGRPEVVFNNTMAGPSQNDPEFPVYVYAGGPGGRFDPARRLELPTGGSNTYVVADLDQDGHADLVCTTRHGLRVFHGGPDGLHPERYTDLRTRGQNIHYVQVGDFDRDGWLDLLAVAYTYDHNPATMAASSVIFHGSAQGFSSARSSVLPTYTKGNARRSGPDRQRLPGPDRGGDGPLHAHGQRLPHSLRRPRRLRRGAQRVPPYRRLEHSADGRRRESRRPPGPAGAGLFHRLQPRAAGAHLLGHGKRLRLRPSHRHPLRVELCLSGARPDRQRLARRPRRMPSHRPGPSRRLAAVPQRSRRARPGASGAAARHGAASEHPARLRQRLHPRAVRALPFPGLRAGRTAARADRLERQHAAAHGRRAAAALGRLA